MRAATILGALAVLAGGAALVVVEGGWVAAGYALAAGGVAALVTVVLLSAWLPPGDPVPPLYLLARPGRAPDASRPAALLDWESALLATRVHGAADPALGRRLGRLVESTLHERRGIGPDDPRAMALLGPAWERVRPGGGHPGGASLDDVEDLVRRLEAL